MHLPYVSFLPLFLRFFDFLIVFQFSISCFSFYIFQAVFILSVITDERKIKRQIMGSCYSASKHHGQYNKCFRQLYWYKGFHNVLIERYSVGYCHHFASVITLTSSYLKLFGQIETILVQFGLWDHFQQYKCISVVSWRSVLLVEKTRVP